jgi:hypothetical protein
MATFFRLWLGYMWDCFRSHERLKAEILIPGYTEIRFTPHHGAGSMHSSVSFLTLLTARLTA